MFRPKLGHPRFRKQIYKYNEVYCLNSFERLKLVKMLK